jgi:predicted HTH domain antitoxin
MNAVLAEPWLEALHLSDLELKRSLLIGLYKEGHISLGKAAELLGMDRFELLSELKQRGICINYGMAEYEEDLRTLKWLESRLEPK